MVAKKFIVQTFLHLLEARFTLVRWLSFSLLTCCLTACFPWSGQQPSSAQSRVQSLPRARLTYVAIGASDTYGTGTDDPQTESWPADLAHRLGPDVHLVNLGIPGIVAHDALNVELPVAIDAHPDLVTIWLAVNDLVANAVLSDYAHDLDALVSRLQSASPHTRIVVVNVPDLTFLPRFHNTNTQDLRAKIDAYNTIIATTVERHHVILVDLFQQWHALADHPDYISGDGFHPNASGYAALSAVVYQALQKK